jgi:hypothetical protein
MQKDFLAGARKKRISYTPRGLVEAWLDLDAAAKVFWGTCIGLVISVSLLISMLCHLPTILPTDVKSSYLPSFSSLAPDASIPVTGSSAP